MLATADRHDGEIAKQKSVRLTEKLASLREQMKAFKTLEVAVHAAPDQQISLTDPDAMAMATNGKGTGMVGYNVQTAVDAAHHLIVAHEVTHEAVIDAMQARMDRAPKIMRVRRATVEHPYGTTKAWMGATHFKLRTLEKVKTERSLHVLAYNLKRVIQILGVQPLMEAMRA
jgi:Transposase DDE domain